MSQGVGRDIPDRDGPAHRPETINLFFKKRRTLEEAQRHLVQLGAGFTGLNKEESIANEVRQFSLSICPPSPCFLY